LLLVAFNNFFCLELIAVESLNFEQQFGTANPIKAIALSKPLGDRLAVHNGGSEYLIPNVNNA